MSDNEKQLVESTLFSASQPISIQEIKASTDLTSQKIRKILIQLIKEYNEERPTAMQIVKAGDKYVMQLKSEYVEQTMMISPPEIEDDILKTLSLIAINQPIKQSNLRRLSGEKIYDHVDRLQELKLIHTKKHRNTEMLTLTKNFPEYFGIDATKPDEIREFLMNKLSKQISKK